MGDLSKTYQLIISYVLIKILNEKAKIVRPHDHVRHAICCLSETHFI